MKEYAFDVRLQAVIRVEASCIQEARRIILHLDAVSAEELACRDAQLTEFSVHGCAKLPFEIRDIQGADD